MSNNNQSSVEWLYNKMYEHRGNITIEEFEEAKAMHKEEIKKAWDNAAIDATYGNKFKNFEDYYNSTFGWDNENN